MKQELDALYHTNTWELVPKPPHFNIVRNHWVHKIKWHADGTIERFKDCLIAKGYTQEYGLDYTDTFSLVVKTMTIRAVLTITVSKCWSIHQLNVNNAFLYENLEATLYMT